VRSGWRLLAWLLAAGLAEGALVTGLAILAGVSPSTRDLPATLTLLLSSVGLLPAVGLSWLFARLFDGEGLADLGLGGGIAHALRELSIGAAIGGLLIVTALVLFMGVGTATMARGSAGAGSLTLGALGLLAAAAKEELWFRGFPFQSFVRAIGPEASMILFGLFFGLAHLTNAHVSWIGFANDAFAGVLLSLALFSRRNLWFPIGLHFAWNFTQGIVLGIPVSGNAGFPSLVTTTLKGADYWTGGEFGIEGSLCGLAAVLIGVAVLFAGFRSAAPFPAPRRARGSDVAAIPPAA